MPDGSRVHVRQAESWCNGCEAFVMSELVQSLPELKEEVAELAATKKERSIGRPLSARLADARLRLQWRKKRHDPPRCLQCASTDIVFVSNAREFVHPQTGERVVRSDFGFVDTAPWHADFSPEGLPLAQGNEDRTMASGY